MTVRNVYLSSSTLAYLEGFAAAVDWAVRNNHGKDNVNISPVESQLARNNLFKVLATTLLQAGAEKFVIPSETPHAVTDSEYLRTRIVSKGDAESENSSDQLTELFWQCLVHKSDSSEAQEARAVQNLIVDLVVALQRGTSLVRVSPMPDIELAAKVLPPEILIPARTLLNAISSVPTSVPVPTAEIKKKDVAILAEILQSDIYLSYCVAHDELRSNDVKPKSALKNISVMALELCKSSGKYMKLDERLVSYLPPTEKLIEELFGKVPGILGSAVAKPLEAWLTSRSRLVIYQCAPVIMQFGKYSVNRSYLDAINKNSGA